MVDPEKVKALRNGTAGRKRGYWTDEDNELLINMFNNQYGITEMAITFEQTEKAIINQLSKLHMYDRVRGENKPKDGCRCPERPKYAHCKGKVKFCHKLGTKNTPKSFAVVLKLRKDSRRFLYHILHQEKAFCKYLLVNSEKIYEPFRIREGSFCLIWAVFAVYKPSNKPSGGRAGNPCHCGV